MFFYENVHLRHKNISFFLIFSFSGGIAYFKRHLPFLDNFVVTALLLKVFVEVLKVSKAPIVKTSYYWYFWLLVFGGHFQQLENIPIFCLFSIHTLGAIPQTRKYFPVLFGHHVQHWFKRFSLFFKMILQNLFYIIGKNIPFPYFQRCWKLKLNSFESIRNK